MTKERQPVRRRAQRAAAAGLAAVTAFAGLSVVAQTPASAKVLLEETFTKASTTPGLWKYVSPKGSHLPCLTAATATVEGSLPACNGVAEGTRKADPVGEGAFEITDSSKQDAGGLLLTKALDARAGLHIEFDQFQYNTSTPAGADGLSFILFDGKAANPETGDPGGSLGYNKSKGSILGVGFDQYGNFSNPKIGWPAGDKGPGVKRNSVVVRAGEAAKYQYVEGKEAPKALAVDKAKKRTDARRKVIVDLSTAGFMDVSVDFGDGPVKMLEALDLNKIEGQPELPPTVKLGFAASTGNSTNVHEVQNFKISTLDPDLTVKTTAGEGGKITATVSNAPTAGPSPAGEQVTVTIPVPQGTKATSAAGDGWTCEPAADKVTCTRSDDLGPGASYPPVEVALESTTGKPVDAKVTAQVDAASDGKPDNNTSEPVDVSVPAGETPPVAGPDLSMALKGEGGTVTATVANAQGAGPTGAEVTAEVSLPDGATVASAAGEGWTCTPQGNKAVCKRPGTGDDALAGGAAFPPITVTGKTDGATVKGKATGATATTGDTKPDNNTAAPVDVTVEGKPPVKPPNLKVTVDGTGNFVPGGSGTLTATVANAADAGPTTKEVTVTVPIPAGMKAGTPTGDGWTCKAATDKVTCTRSDVLQPGGSYPPVNVPVTAGKDLATPVNATATTATADDGDTSDNTAAPVALPKPGLKVEMAVTPNPYKPGGKLTYEIKVSNTGSKPVDAAQIKSAVAQVWKDVPWTCLASDGSTCPAPKGKGEVTGTIKVLPGGTVTFTADCQVPAGVKAELKGSATVTAPGDANCDKGCTVKASSTVG